jgi:ArsR family transcriptional regulator
LQIPQPTASKAFKALKSAGLVQDRRESNWIYYRLSPDMPKWARSIVFIAARELEQSDAFAADDKRFERSRVKNRSPCQ